MSTIRAVIFDVDGTLVDSNDAHAHAWVDALAESGRAVTFERIRPLIGMGGDKVLPILAGLSSKEGEGKRIAERRERIFAERYFPALRPFDGAEDLIRRLRDEGLRLAVASSSKKAMLERLLGLVGGKEMFEVTTSSDDANSSKPDPDIVQVALERLGEDRGRVVMIGDTPYDVEAAARAGIRSIAFRCGGWNDEDLRGASAIYDGPRDLLEKLAGSILGSGTAIREAATATRSGTS